MESFDLDAQRDKRVISPPISGEKGCTVSEGGPDDGYETEHGVVHVSRGVDNLHTNPLILVAPRSLRLTLLTSPISPYVLFFILISSRSLSHSRF